MSAKQVSNEKKGQKWLHYTITKMAGLTHWIRHVHGSAANVLSVAGQSLCSLNTISWHHNITDIAGV